MRTVTDTRGILDPARGAEHFSLTRHAAHPGLADWVQRNWVVTWDLRGRDPYVSEVLPHPCVNLAFTNGDGRVWGVAPEADRRRLEGRGMAVAAKFRPGAFLAFAPHLSQKALVGGSVSLAEAFGAGATAALEATAREAAAAGDATAQAEALEAFLLQRVPDAPDRGARLVQEVVATMTGPDAQPDARVTDVAAAHGVSARTLQRLFDRHVGLGPKWVLQRYRLHLAAERLADGETDVTRLALDLGYFDLPHFIGHFRANVGRTPAEFARGVLVGP